MESGAATRSLEIKVSRLSLLFSAELSITSRLHHSVSPGILDSIRVKFLNAVFAVLLYYDYFLTLDDEVTYFWGRRFNSVTTLFFLNRYLSLFINIPIIVHNFGHLSSKVRLRVTSQDQ